jgi:hypothetical protein
MTSVTWRLGALLATAALLSACSNGPGPLGDGGVQAEQCVPARQGQTITMGIYALGNKTNSTVTVRSVRLGSPHGLAMTRAWMTPIFHTTLIGAVLSWPPVSRAWAERKRATGAVIKPFQHLNLVFGLTRTSAKTGRSGGPVLVYTADHNTYTLTENTSLIVAARCF